MKTIDLPLSELTIAQKLHLMEALWDDLTKHEQMLESPEWHEEVLRDREEAMSAEKGIVSTWAEAKDRIRKKTSRT
jgi:putative addiction module component (TIGR02574 family)